MRHLDDLAAAQARGQRAHIAGLQLEQAQVQSGAYSLVRPREGFLPDRVGLAHLPTELSCSPLQQRARQPFQDAEVSHLALPNGLNPPP